MQRHSQQRKRSKNLGVIPLQPQTKPPIGTETRWYRLKNQRWLKVEYNPITGKIRSPYGIWQYPAKGAELVKVKPSQTETTNQATVPHSTRLAITKPDVEKPSKKISTKEFLEQKALERQLKAIEKHNIYVQRNLRQQ